MPILPSQVTEAVPPVLTGRYLPTAQDVLTIRSYFLLLRKPLCRELVDVILDEACYWAHSTVEVEYPVRANIWNGKDHMYLRTLPLAIPGTEDYIHAAGSCLSYGAMTRAGQPLIPAIRERTRDRTPGGMLLSRPHSWKSLVI